MKVWITKYALSLGVWVCEAEVCESISKGMIKIPEDPERPFASDCVDSSHPRSHTRHGVKLENAYLAGMMNVRAAA